MIGQYLKHLMVRSPIEQAALGLKRALEWPDRRRNPALAAIHAEPGFVEAGMRRLLGRHSRCIDVGAHLGSQLSLFLRLAPQGRHLAFEPVPRKAAWLRRKFPEVEVHETALGARSGEVSFFVNTSRPGYSGLHEHHQVGDHRQKITVAQLRLDEVVGQRRFDFIKIDVEGAELSVLEGASALLDRCRPAVLFESTATALAAARVTPGQIHDFLVGRHRYQIYLPRALVTGGRPLGRDCFAAAHVYPFQAFNFFALPCAPPAA
jgi:FkbM family methyltransferase